MTVTTTNYGRYRVFVTDSTTTDDKITQLAQAFNDHNIDAKKVIYFDVGSVNTAVAEVGRG